MRLLKRIIFYLHLTILYLAFIPISPSHAQDGQAWAILNLLNADRNAAGLHSLTMNTQLVAAAQRHSNDMANGDFLSHTGSDGSEFWERIADTGYNMTSGAENILFRWDLSAAGAYQQWWNSPGHYNNMMNANYVEIGIAWAQAASGKYYYTMVLATRPGVQPPPISPPTNTPIPPTPVPPTSTPIPPTPVPPTSTPILPTNTAIPSPIPPTAVVPSNTPIPP
ncbi:MAG: CAP domain-containing protein, partial [Chloroflexi bacterium]